MLFPKPNFGVIRGNNENQTRKINSFLHWVMSSASSPPRKTWPTDSTDGFLELEFDFFKKIGNKGKCKASVGRVGTAIHRRRQVSNRIANKVVALLNIIVTCDALFDISHGMNSNRLLTCRFSAGELPFPQPPRPHPPLFSTWGAHSCLHVDHTESLFLPCAVTL